MIDFRYHLVSLIAVFLAVALGIVIGTTQLNGPLTDNLQGQVTALQDDKRSLEDQTQTLQTQLDDVGSFDEAVGPTLVENTLVGQRVVLVVVLDVVSVVVALLNSELTVFIHNSKTMVWVSQSSQYPNLKEVLMLKNTSLGS